LIENELRTLQQEIEFLPTGTIMSWNHAEFGIRYLETIQCVNYDLGSLFLIGRRNKNWRLLFALFID